MDQKLTGCQALATLKSNKNIGAMSYIRTLCFLLLQSVASLKTNFQQTRSHYIQTKLYSTNSASALEHQNARLEETISELRARIAELEGQEQSTTVRALSENSLGVKNGWKGVTLPSMQNGKLSMAPDDLDDVEEGEWCEVLEDGTPDALCEKESTDDFLVALRSRVTWLVGLLTLQSMSSIILSDYELLIQAHPSIVFFLTMLVGAGGNAGNQSAVRIIRGLATGSITERTKWQFLEREVKMAIGICVIVTLVGFVRVAAFSTPPTDTIAITASLAIISLSSVVLGAALPLLLDKLRIDAAHASTSIQVIMDIMGVLIVCAISQAVFSISDGSIALLAYSPTANEISL